jgi:hypothetical protein
MERAKLGDGEGGADVTVMDSRLKRDRSYFTPI